MKHPISRLAGIGRELLCYFIGHNYKWADREKTGEWGTLEKYNSYKRAYWRPVSGWEFKCRRCRAEWADGSEPYVVWFVAVGRGIKYFWQEWKYWFFVHIDDADTIKAFSIYPFSTIFSAFFRAFAQFMMQIEDRFHTPVFTWDIPLCIADWFHNRMWTDYGNKHPSIFTDGTQ